MTALFTVTETHYSPRGWSTNSAFGSSTSTTAPINVNPVTVDDAGIDRPTNNLTSNIYKFTFATSGFQFGPTPQANQCQTQNNYNFVDNLSWVRGQHTYTVGGQYTRVSLDKLFPAGIQRAAVLHKHGDGLTDFAEFFGGTPAFSFGGGGVYNHEYRQNNYATVCPGRLEIRPDLTVNLGLRTEFLGASRMTHATSATSNRT